MVMGSKHREMRLPHPTSHPQPVQKNKGGAFGISDIEHLESLCSHSSSFLLTVLEASVALSLGFVLAFSVYHSVGCSTNGMCGHALASSGIPVYMRPLHLL